MGCKSEVCYKKKEVGVEESSHRLSSRGRGKRWFYQYFSLWLDQRHAKVFLSSINFIASYYEFYLQYSYILAHQHTSHKGPRFLSIGNITFKY